MWRPLIALALAVTSALPPEAHPGGALPAPPVPYTAVTAAGSMPFATLAGGVAPAGSVPSGARAAGGVAACGPVVAEPLAEAPWALKRLRPDLAWPLSTGAGVRVAVIDSGVSKAHPAMEGKVLPGNDFVTSGGGDCDENGHGTLIAGIIAGRQSVSNGYAFHGVAPDAQIVPVRVLRDQSRTFEEELPARIATAIRWAIDTGGAKVVNLSLTTTHSPDLQAAIRYGVGKGVVFVAAAGNEGASKPGEPVYPASYDGVIAVASVDRNDAHVGTSTTGSYVDIAAPGIEMSGPAPAGGGYLYSEQGGTSFAAGYVSGVAALIRAYDPSLDPQQVAERITSTADHPAEIWNPVVGYGVVNPQRAVGALAPLNLAASGPAAGITAPVADGDPLRELTLLAGWLAFAGVIAAGLSYLLVAAHRRGRRRHWRPTRPDPPPPTIPNPAP